MMDAITISYGWRHLPLLLPEKARPTLIRKKQGGTLAGDDRRRTGVEMIDDLAGGIERSIARSGDPYVAIIPEGPYVVLCYAA